MYSLLIQCALSGHCALDNTAKSSHTVEPTVLTRDMRAVNRPCSLYGQVRLIGDLIDALQRSKCRPAFVTQAALQHLNFDIENE